MDPRGVKCSQYIYKMSTFEKVKHRILRDMSTRSVHTAESWASMMLQNTNELSDIDEQKKFWAWMVNPSGEEQLKAECDVFDEHVPITQEPHVTVKSVDNDDEKDEGVEMDQHFKRNGMAMYIRVTNKAK